jgi:hypothetical protein
MNQNQTSRRPLKRKRPIAQPDDDGRHRHRDDEYHAHDAEQFRKNRAVQIEREQHTEAQLERQ